MLRRLLFIMVALGAFPAWADMDYRCLSECKSDGISTQSCMKQCSYVAPGDMAKTKKTASGTAHNEFSGLAVGSVILPPKPASAGKTSVPNAACVQECMRDGMQYSLCATRCLPKP